MSLFSNAKETLRLLFTEVSHDEQEKFSTIIAEKIKSALPNLVFDEFLWGETMLLSTPREEGGEFTFCIWYEKGNSAVDVIVETTNDDTSTTTIFRLNEFRALPTKAGLDRIAKKAVETIQAPLNPNLVQNLGSLVID